MKTDHVVTHKSKILFLGLFFNESQLKEFSKYSKKGLQMATHLYQERLLKGFAQNEVDITTFNIPPIGSFPISFKKLYLSYPCGDSRIHYLNLPIIKHISQKHQLFKYVQQCLKKERYDSILIYSLYEPFLYVGKKIKNMYPDIKIGLIQTDSVPGRNDMYVGRRYYSRGTKLLNYTKDFDYFILLSRYLVEPLLVGKRPWLIAECICDEKQKISNQKKHNDRIFLYTGTTNKEFGIMNLVEAFAQLPDCRLWICGSGDSDKEIQRMSSICSNIKHFGFLSQTEVAKKRDECDYLINPRTPSGTYTLYSFPSKTSEYLCSGKPLVMYRLESFEEEYFPYITFLHSDKKDDITKEIQNIVNSDYKDLCLKALRARDFMLNNKTSYNQARRIINFINNDVS